MTLLLILLHHSRFFLQFCLIIFACCLSSCFGWLYVFLFSFFLFSSSCIFPSLVFPSLHQFLASLRVSRLIVFSVGFCPYSSSFSSCVSSSPQAPRADLKRKTMDKKKQIFIFLVAPYRAILRYYRCDTPCRVILSQPSQQSPNRVRYPLWCLLLHRYISAIPISQHIARYVCDTPGKQARKSFAILSLKVSRDMKSIAAGPLSSFCLPFRDLCENVLSKIVMILFGGCFHPQNIFWLDVVGICFQGVRYSLLLLRCCCFVVWVFGKEPSFGPTCLLCLHSLDLLCSLFVFFLFCVFLLV